MQIHSLSLNCSLGKGPNNNKNGQSMVFDHTPLTTPPLKHIYGPLIANFFKKKFLQ